MSIQRQWALLAAVIYLGAAFVQSLPVADDKADEMIIVSAMNVPEVREPSTESPMEEEHPKPKDSDTNHIQIIKMPSAEEAAEIIEELEEEIEREKEAEAEMKAHLEEADEELKDTKDLKEDENKSEPKKEQLMEVINAGESPKNEMMMPMSERSPRNMQMDETDKQPEKATTQASSLTDEDIDTIMKMISFPQTDDDEKNFAEENKNTETAVKVEVEVEPRTTDAESTEAKPRIGRAIRSEGSGKGYYILAFSPVEGPLVPTYTKFDIIPIERSVDGGPNVDDYDEDEAVDGELEEGRLISRKQFNHYIRKMMRQIRKGTRKIQRKTRLRSAVEDEPTVENFVRKWYETNQKGKAAAAATPKRSWFTWAQKPQ